MTTTEEISAVSREIAALHKKQQALVEARKLELKGKLETLDFLKGKTFVFQERFGPYGNTEWVMVLGGRDDDLDSLLPGSPHLCVYGTDKQYFNNVTVRRSEGGGYEFYSCNADAFVKFVELIGAKFFHFDCADKLKVYGAVTGRAGK